jgi:MFS transporter, DHA3 family, macrolide efflux protein
LLGVGIALAATLARGASQPNVMVAAAAAFIAPGSAAIIAACVQTLLHTKVEPHLLRRAIGAKNAVVGGPHLVGNVAAMAVGAALVPIIGQDEVRSPAVSIGR